MPYMHMLSDPGMNYTLNRPLLDGTSAARIKEIDAVAPQIKDYESWHAVWLRLSPNVPKPKSGGSMPPRTTAARSSIFPRGEGAGNIARLAIRSLRATTSSAGLRGSTRRCQRSTREIECLTEMKLAFEVVGKGDPVIILHGFLGSSDNWRSMSRRLGSHYQVFAVDLRNHGRSPHSDILDYDVMVADVREFMEQQALRRIMLLGHSMGEKLLCSSPSSIANKSIGWLS